MRSVGGPVSIVATIITLVLVPAFNKDGKVVRFHTKKVAVAQLKCQRGARIPASPAAKRLGVVGKVCRNVIPVVRVIDSNKVTKKAPLKRARTRP